MNYKSTGRSIEILLVEDNPGDVRLTEEALKEGKVLNGNFALISLFISTAITYSYLHIPVNRLTTLDPQ